MAKAPWLKSYLSIDGYSTYARFKGGECLSTCHRPYYIFGRFGGVNRINTNLKLKFPPPHQTNF